jgi:hypothetical protein
MLRLGGNGRVRLGCFLVSEQKVAYVKFWSGEFWGWSVKAKKGEVGCLVKVVVGKREVKSGDERKPQVSKLHGEWKSVLIVGRIHA